VRTALLVVVVSVAALIAATYAFGGRGGGASASWTIGSSTYVFGGSGSCQTVGGDVSVAVAAKGEYFHLIWTRKSHGNYRTVAYRYSYLTDDAIIGAKIKFAAGRRSGTFSGLSTKGVRVTGSFNCG
jgi:hypothetical protein